MSNDALWAARLHLNTGIPATLLDTETIRAICELVDEQDKRIAAAERRCREEVLKEREACARLADLCIPGAPSEEWSACQRSVAATIRARNAPQSTETARQCESDTESEAGHG